MDVEARLEGVQQYQIHSTPYFRVYFSLPDAPDQVQQCQLPFDAFDASLKPGDPIIVTYLLRTVMQIRAAPNPSS
jgi:hypothetical protein